MFNGWSSGIWPKYTQHIKASKINGLLRGFGISCSRPMAVQNKTGKQKHCRFQKGFRSWNSFFSWTNELTKNFLNDYLNANFPIHNLTGIIIPKQCCKNRNLFLKTEKHSLFYQVKYSTLAPGLITLSDHVENLKKNSINLGSITIFFLSHGYLHIRWISLIG